MDETFLAQLRCPLDPAREATLAREEQQLVCSGCRVHFPIKQGLPVLVPDEAELPAGMREFSQLPCHRRANRRKNAN
ncbi:MAG TPA: Trm112 family protein [Gemmata sp.]